MRHLIEIIRFAKSINEIVDPDYRYGYEDDLREYGFLWHYGNERG